MLNKVKETVLKYNMIRKNDIIITGFSGGADSCFLLYMLNELKNDLEFEIIAVHINHMLRGKESDDDQIFAEKVCKNYNLHLKTFNYDVLKFAKENKITTEEAGRILRYQSFNNVLDEYGGNKIAVAHNKNDHAETILMRFMRGTGLKGLSGINYVNNNIIRPILNISRNEIENFCNINNIDFRIDSSNEEILYTRNKVRLELIPYIEKNLNQNIIETLFELSSLYNEENIFLDTITNDFCTNHIEDKGILVEEFLKLDAVIKRRVVRQVLENLTPSLKDISYKHIDSIVNLAYKQNGKSINLPYNIIVTKKYKYLCFEENIVYNDFCYNLELDEFTFIKEINKFITISLTEIKNGNKFYNIYTKKYSYDKINNVIQIRSRQEGDYIILKGIDGSKKIKKFFIDEKIPKNKRNTIPLLADGHNILWIMNMRESSYYTVSSSEEKTLYVQLWKELENGRKD